MRVLLWLACAFLGASCQTGPRVEQHSTKLAVTENLSILQGATDQTSTVLSILAPIGKHYEYRILLDKTLLRTPTPEEIEEEGFLWKIVNISLENLAPGVLYTLQIYENGVVFEQRQFQTLSNTLKHPKIAVISCTDDSFSDAQKKQWAAVLNTAPDMLFLIGDNVYVDKSLTGPITTTDIWRRHQETRLNLDMYKWKKLIPVYATWDDHDYGAGDGNRTFALKDHSREVFSAFFPGAKSQSLVSGPGIAKHVAHEKNHFILLDDRYFRSPKGEHPETHFGKEQEDWLFKIIKKNKGTFWLISGDQFFGGYHTFESYQGVHPQSFKKFIERLRDHKKNIVFVSGDRHLAEFMKLPSLYLGYTTYELTSSGLHAKTYPGAAEKFPNPHRVFIKDGEYNFLVIQPLESSKFRAKANVEFFGDGGRSLYKTQLEIAR